MISFTVLSFPALLSFAAASDVLTMRISNWLSASLALAFFIAAAAIGMNFPAVAWHIILAMLVLLAGFALFTARILGGGDAKLLAGAALWVGPQNFPDLMIYIALSGGLVATMVLLLRQLRLLFGLRIVWASHLYNADSGVPYGVAICIGGLAVFPETPWFAALLKA